MAKHEKKRTKPGLPTQRFLDIAEIREDCVVLKDGTLRAVLLTSSINFALKSEDEQQAIIQGYMQFLNGLEFPIHICIQSRRMNIDGYLDRLNAEEKAIPNELLKTQIREYRSFIGELVELGEIMQKRFFVIVPLDTEEGETKGKNFMSKVQAALFPASIVKLNEKVFTKRRDILAQRVATTTAGLGSMGLQVVRLDTQGLVELYYTAYNPDVYDHEKMVDVGKLRVESGF